MVWKLQLAFILPITYFNHYDKQYKCFENLPSLFTAGADSSNYSVFDFNATSHIFVFRKNWDKLKILSKRYVSNEISESNQLLCLKCETINPSFANFCKECGTNIKAKYASTSSKTLAFISDLIFVILFGILLILIISLNIINPGMSVGIIGHNMVLLDILVFSFILCFWI